ncbi:ROK family protein [Clostridium tarantellae]|uniref:ROK family protein n=1 Tax=Clostridium tarantellae TaxID=39493 RepID=A0A6I1MJR9_9CLOT|nr:ROK family protein [Clostridium tarantellae]MPQ42658.1 ROK family protein [Clostridium tarantellae]
MQKYIAFDIGGTKIKYGVLNEIGQIITKGETNTRNSSLDIFLGDLQEIIRNYKTEYEICGIAMSMPGVINPKTGIIDICRFLRCAEGINIKEELKNRTGLNVAIENDAKCVVLAEKFNGAAVENNNFACITLGTGVGGGLFINGELVAGNTFKAGEVSYMIVNGINEGNKGFEITNENASTRGLINMYKKYKNIDKETEIEGNIIFEEGKKDFKVKAIINNWYRNIAYVVYNICAMINPEKILIGGGITSRSQLLDELKVELNEIPWWSDIEVELGICKHKNNAGMIGAVYNYIINYK